MKEEKRLILPCVLVAAALVCVLLLSTLIVTERGTCGEGLSWTLNAGGRLVVSGQGAIPDYDLDGERVSPFYERSVVNAVLGDGVTAIGAQAFRGCVNLRSVTIPAGVESIGDLAFMGCGKLSRIELDENNAAFTVEDGVLFNADKTELLFCSPKRGGKTYSVPDTVVRIAPGAFYGCKKLQSVTLPDSVTEIGELAFTECAALKDIVLSASQTHFSYTDGAFVCVDTAELLFYSPAAGAEGYTVPASVKTVAPRAFYGCKKLTEVVLSEGVTGIGDVAFGGCSGLTEIVLPNSLEAVGNSAFRGCSALKTVSLSSENARFRFADSMLTDVQTNTLLLCVPGYEGDVCTVPDGTLAIASDAFYGCKAIRKLYVPASVAGLNKNAFAGCSGVAQLHYAGDEAAWAALTEKVETGLTSKTKVLFNS